MNDFDEDEDDSSIEPGDEVRFTGVGGWPDEAERATEHLIVGGTYTVADVEVHSWHTKVYLDGFPNISFNSVLFDKVEDDV